MNAAPQRIASQADITSEINAIAAEYECTGGAETQPRTPNRA
ncbi:hypothetical protein [Mycobacterium kansasii]|nr:hypothetical protein [Mycobacterium kansasii]